MERLVVGFDSQMNSFPFAACSVSYFRASVDYMAIVLVGVAYKVSKGKKCLAFGLG